MTRSVVVLLTCACATLLSVVLAKADRGEATGTSPTPNTALVAGPAADATRQKMQLALLLDTSSSMDGLIEQAKSQLWSTLVALSQTQKDGEAPVLEMALYEYGNSRLSARSGYLRQVIPFTSDMDAVSAALFELTTAGGEEYCGQVITRSLTELAWENHPDAARIVFIAGNESFGQGPVSFYAACAKTAEADIVVNTIFCGPCETGIAQHWKEGADLTGGHYSCIDQNEVTAYIATPYDEALAALDTQLNETYLAYGASGAARQRRQRAQDQNAIAYGTSNAINRTAFKASSNYSNAGWDLVDAYATDSTIVERAAATTPALAGKTAKEVKQHIEQLTRERIAFREQIRSLSQQRDAYIQRERERGPVSGGKLEHVMLEATYEQAAAKGFVRPDAPAVGALSPTVSNSETESLDPYPSALVSLDDFSDLMGELADVREDRLLNLHAFLTAAKEPNTIILDARSRQLYQQRHLRGAINMPYTEFSQGALASVIPSPDTRVLIYCNNNFDGDTRNFTSKTMLPPVNSSSTQSSRMLALNVPTHLTLRGYGYTDVYELDELVSVYDTRLAGMWAGTDGVPGLQRYGSELRR